MEAFKTVLITGGAGFIGSHVVRRMVTKYPKTNIVNLDALTYAGNLDNIADVAKAANYTFVEGDITNTVFIKTLFEQYRFDAVVHLAAESHVDNSIKNPLGFAQTNVMGTLNLLEASRIIWKDNLSNKRFYHISTDEVFGSLGSTGSFTEETPYDPRSPYSASKAASDHFVRAYFHTYGLPVVLSNCSNNYGPAQFPEKLIPLFIKNIVENRPLPVYGKGENIRDWLYVEDHVEAIDVILHNGKPGETYAIGGNNEIRNIDMVHALIAVTDRLLGRSKGSSKKLISYVSDRLGHDFRYAIDASKIKNDLGWTPKTSFEEGIEKTVQANL
jgi:dTDP-glucose 4,6-dehydratase|tara:strand:+ start:570 stop:1556 length:987 start_codon:yes stop_codon:yes gene_type:complete